MFGRLVTLLVAAVATISVAGPANAADSSYGPKTNTTCNVAVRVSAGKPVAVRVTVKGNAADPIAGTVHVGVTNSGTGQSAYSRSIAYNNKPVTVRGPVLKTGNYQAKGVFKAGSGVYAGSSCTHSFHARGVADEHTGHHPHPGGHQPGGTGPSNGGGGLPNTGGPSVLWLLLGCGLVLAGGTTVLASKRTKVHAWTA